MTCIVAIVGESGKVIMGADSAGVGGYSIQDRIDPKIYKVGKMLIGYTSSYRMGQLLGYSLNLPKHKKSMTTEQYMNTLFINEVRNCFAAGGFMTLNAGQEKGGTFIVGYRGRIFSVEDDYQIGETRENYASVGCGADIALGSLHTTEDMDILSLDRLSLSLKAAANFSAGVNPPFIYSSEK